MSLAKRLLFVLLFWPVIWLARWMTLGLRHPVESLKYTVLGAVLFVKGDRK